MPENMTFLSFVRNISSKYGKKFIRYIATKRRLADAQTTSKKEVHKIAEPPGAMIGNKIAKIIVKLELVPNKN